MSGRINRKTRRHRQKSVKRNTRRYNRTRRCKKMICRMRGG